VEHAVAHSFGGDPVPQAMVITGIVVAFAGTAMAVAPLMRYHALTGRTTFPPVAPPQSKGGDAP